MVKEKRTIKENSIIDAAERVFFQKGYSAAKMEEVAKEAGMSKPSLYFYFQSKEELYMAITFRAFQLLTDIYYQIIRETSELNGADRVIRIMEGYIDYSEKHFFYHEALFDYLSLVRNMNKLSGADQNKVKSIYYQRIQDVHNLPVSIVVKEIESGKSDGSITNPESSETIYLTAWAIVAGYIKLSIYGGGETIHHVSLKDWKGYIIKLTRELLSQKLS